MPTTRPALRTRSGTSLPRHSLGPRTFQPPAEGPQADLLESTVFCPRLPLLCWVEQVVEGVRKLCPAIPVGRVLLVGEQGRQTVAVQAGRGEGQVLAAVPVFGMPGHGGGETALGGHDLPGGVGQGSQPGTGRIHAQRAARRVPRQQGVGPVRQPESTSAAGGGAGQVLQRREETSWMKGPFAAPDEGAHTVFVTLLRKQRARRMDARGSRCDVEACKQGGPRLTARSGRLPRARGELVEQRVSGVVGAHHVLTAGSVLDQCDQGRVLQLPCEGVADGALVVRCGGQPHLGQVVAVGEVRQDEGRVDRGDDSGQHQRCAGSGDDRGHGLGLDGVPQFHDGQPTPAFAGEPQQFGH